jgi:hypothetical protein
MQRDVRRGRVLRLGHLRRPREQSVSAHVARPDGLAVEQHVLQGDELHGHSCRREGVLADGPAPPWGDTSAFATPATLDRDAGRSLPRAMRGLVPLFAVLQSFSTCGGPSCSAPTTERAGFDANALKSALGRLASGGRR